LEDAIGDAIEDEVSVEESGGTVYGSTEGKEGKEDAEIGGVGMTGESDMVTGNETWAESKEVEREELTRDVEEWKGKICSWKTTSLKTKNCYVERSNSL
jgi:hypothetical protein